MTQRVLSMVLHSFETDNRVLRACMSLAKAGYEVKVAALHEHGLSQSETIGPIEVERVRLWTRDWSKWRPVLVLKYFEWAARVAWRFRKYDILHCNDLNTLPAGVLIKILSLGRARLVYDAHEFESDHGSSQSRWSIAALQVLEGTLIRFADEFITVSAGISDEYRRLYGIEAPSIVMNCPRYQKPKNADRFRKRFGIRPDQTIFLTQGWLRPNRGIECMLETFSQMVDDKNVLVVMGRGHLGALVEDYAGRFSNIYLHPVVPPEDVLIHTVSADYGVALIKGTSFSYRHCLPNKLFEYVMAGLPVIVSNLPEMKRVVEGMEIGVVCQESTPRALAKAIDELKNMDRTKLERNLEAARARYCWEAQEKVWLQAVRGVTA